MAQVQVPASWFAQGALPGICARHGGPATGMLPRKLYSRTPVWVLLLIPLGLLIAAIVALAIRSDINGRLPSCGLCAADRRRFVRRVWAGWGIVVLLPVSAVGLSAVGVESGFLFALLFLAIPAALIFSFSFDSFRVRGRFSKDRLWVELKGVSDEFAGTLDAARRALPLMPRQGTPVGYGPAGALPPAPGTPLAAPGPGTQRH